MCLPYYLEILQPNCSARLYCSKFPSWSTSAAARVLTRSTKHIVPSDQWWQQQVGFWTIVSYPHLRRAPPDSMPDRPELSFLTTFLKSGIYWCTNHIFVPAAHMQPRYAIIQQGYMVSARDLCGQEIQVGSSFSA